MNNASLSLPFWWLEPWLPRGSQSCSWEHRSWGTESLTAWPCEPRLPFYHFPGHLQTDILHTHTMQRGRHTVIQRQPQKKRATKVLSIYLPNIDRFLRATASTARIPRKRGHQRGVPPLEIIVLPLLAHLAWKRLQIDTDLLLIITSTADELSSGTNIGDLERPWAQKYAF